MTNRIELHLTARVVGTSNAHKAKPTDIAPLQEGGVGIAWSTKNAYADVEIRNAKTIDFSISSGRTSIDFISISFTDNNDAADEIDDLIGRIKKVTANDG
jgi:hypothetical protein